MPPTLRSSAPSTPAKKTVDGDTPTPRSTPRKTPHCTRCQRPRAGHPRQGCPYIDSPIQIQPGGQISEVLTNALDALHIERPSASDENTSSRRRRSSVKFAPQASLASLSTDSREVVEGLLQPGIMNDEADEDERRDAVARWQEAMTTPRSSTNENKFSVRAKMPGTLNTPFTSFYDSQQLIPAAGAERKDPIVARSPSIISSSTAQPTTASVRPLVRSMSVEERNVFLEGLVETSKTSPATVYTHRVEDIPIIQETATKLGFCTRVAASPEKGLDYLILGRDEKAVMDLHKIVTQRGPQGRSALSTAAGGAVVGAVATWTGLAFS